MKKENSGTKIPYILICTLLAVSFLLSGCENETDQKAEDKAADPPTIVIEDKEPAMVIERYDEGNESDKETDKTEKPKETSDEYVMSEEEKNDPRVRAVDNAAEGHVTLEFAGDINYDDGYANMNNFHSCGGSMSGVLSQKLIDEMRSADIFMINNEFPYSDRGTPTPNKQFTFRAKPERVDLMNEIGVDIVSLANNHAYDYGPQALLDTFDTLDGAGIPYVGAGRNIDEACSPFYFISGGIKIGFVSATQIERTDPPDTKEATADSPGVLRTLDPSRFKGVISKCDENDDFTVVYVHWGSENTYDVDQSQRDLAQAYVEAGADLIIGDHSHCLQGFEYVDGVPVIYSMGNFWFSSKNIDTGLVSATVTKDGLESIRFIPCVQHDCRTDMYEKGDGEYSRILGVMAGLSYDVSIDEDGYVHDGVGNGVDPVEPKPLKKASYQLTDEEKALEALSQMAGELQQTEVQTEVPENQQ